jgi:uncharacterized tellurite resistance protein B-like protein
VTAVRLLEAEVHLPETYLRELDPEARRGIYRAACRMAIVDHVLHETERRMLDKLRDMLAVTHEAASEIEHDIPELI